MSFASLDYLSYSILHNTLAIIMHTTLVLAALAAVISAVPQGVTADITPTLAAPAGCATSYSGDFQVTAVKVSTKRDLTKVLTTTLLFLLQTKLPC